MFIRRLFSTRTHSCGALNANHAGQQVTLAGWMLKPRLVIVLVAVVHWLHRTYRFAGISGVAWLEMGQILIRFTAKERSTRLSPSVIHTERRN
jgi:hypothetical protein